MNFKIDLIEKQQQHKLNKKDKLDKENDKNIELIKMKIKLSKDFTKMIESLIQSNDEKNIKIDLSKQLFVIKK